MDALEQGDPARLGGGVDGLGGNEQADGGDEEDRGEDVSDELEVGEEREAARDEESAHEDGSGDSPEEDLGLVGGSDLEEAEEEQEDEEIVDRHGLFEDVAGEVLDGGGGAEGVVEIEGEGESGGDPEGGRGDGGVEGVVFAADLATRVEEFDGEEEQEGEVEADPVRKGRGGHAYDAIASRMVPGRAMNPQPRI